MASVSNLQSLQSFENLNKLLKTILFCYNPAMLEKIKRGETMNAETRKFVEGLKSELICSYQDDWIRFQDVISVINAGGIVGHLSELGLINSENITQVLEDSKKAVKELESRGFIVQKLPGAIENMLAEQKELPLPEFLQKDLQPILYNYDVCSVKGTILDSKGRAVRYQDRESPEPKSRGVVGVFNGRQIALKILYGIYDDDGDLIIPTSDPTSVTLIPASFVNGKYWCGPIYLR